MSNKIFLKYDKLKWLTSHQTHGNNFTDYIAFWKIKQYSETNRKGRYFGFSWCKFRCLEMSLCLTVIKVKDNMQINNFYWGSVEQQCLVSLYKLFWGKKTPFFFDKASCLLAYSDRLSVEIYTSVICIEVSYSEMCRWYKIFAPEWQDWTNSEDMAQCCHSVFPPKKLLSRDMHCITYHKKKNMR